MIITSESHVDHVSQDVLDYVLSVFDYRKEFFIEEIVLPDSFPPVMSALWGPLSGDPPVPEERCIYRSRGGRSILSRLVPEPPRPTRKLVVIAGPDGDEPCVLYTVYGGPMAPREPDDPSLSPEERAESVEFWAEHALSPFDSPEEFFQRFTAALEGKVD